MNCVNLNGLFKLNGKQFFAKIPFWFEWVVEFLGDLIMMICNVNNMWANDTEIAELKEKSLKKKYISIWSVLFSKLSVILKKVFFSVDSRKIVAHFLWVQYWGQHDDNQCIKSVGKSPKKVKTFLQVFLWLLWVPPLGFPSELQFYKWDG